MPEGALSTFGRRAGAQDQVYGRIHRRQLFSNGEPVVVVVRMRQLAAHDGVGIVNQRDERAIGLGGETVVAKTRSGEDPASGTDGFARAPILDKASDGIAAGAAFDRPGDLDGEFGGWCDWPMDSGWGLGGRGDRIGCSQWGKPGQEEGELEVVGGDGRAKEAFVDFAGVGDQDVFERARAEVDRGGDGDGLVGLVENDLADGEKAGTNLPDWGVGRKRGWGRSLGTGRFLGREQFGEASGAEEEEPGAEQESENRALRRLASVRKQMACGSHGSRLTPGAGFGK